MPSRIQLQTRALALPLLFLSLTGCYGPGLVGDVLASTAGVLGSSNVSGELRQVDTRRQVIVVRSTRGQNERVLYDSRTEVIHRQARYSVRDLRTGDVVRVRGERDRRGDLYARRIDIERMTQTSGRGQARVQLQRLEGSVGRIDTRAGWFELRQTRGGSITVSLPYQANRSLSDRFRRLRTGNRVRIEAERLNRNRVEVHRFL